LATPSGCHLPQAKSKTKSKSNSLSADGHGSSDRSENSVPASNETATLIRLIRSSVTIRFQAVALVVDLAVALILFPATPLSA
jgi:hypothetical protein